MTTWDADPLWQFFARLRPPVRIAASDVLVPVITERAHRPRRIGTYKGLDRLLAALKAGVPGVIIRR